MSVRLLMDTHVTQPHPCPITLWAENDRDAHLSLCTGELPVSLATDCAGNSRVHQLLKTVMTTLQNVTGRNPLFGSTIKMKADRNFVTFIVRRLCLHIPRKWTFLRELALQIPLKRKSGFSKMAKVGLIWQINVQRKKNTQNFYVSRHHVPLLK